MLASLHSHNTLALGTHATQTTTSRPIVACTPVHDAVMHSPRQWRSSFGQTFFPQPLRHRLNTCPRPPPFCSCLELEGEACTSFRVMFNATQTRRCAFRLSFLGRCATGIVVSNERRGVFPVPYYPGALCSPETGLQHRRRLIIGHLSTSITQNTYMTPSIPRNSTYPIVSYSPSGNLFPAGNRINNL